MSMKQRDDNPSGQKNSTQESELSIYLEEYKTLSSEIIRRVGFQQRILNYQLIVAGIIAVVGTKLITLDYNIPINVTFAQYFLLLSPMLFYSFSWSFSKHDIMIVSLARYKNIDLRPRIKELVGGKDILRYEDFLQNERKREVKLLGIFTALGEEYLLPLLFPAILIIVYASIFPSGDLQWLLYFNIFLLGLTIVLKIGAGRNYLRI